MRCILKKLSYVLIAVFLMLTSIIQPRYTVYANEKDPPTVETWRRFVSGDRNDNGTNAALLKNLNPVIDQLQDGFMEFTIQPQTTKNDTRFGVYIKYKDINNFVFVGMDRTQNWFYEYKVNGTGSYPKLNVNSPDALETQNVKLQWRGSQLTVNIDGVEKVVNIDALVTLANSPLRLKAGSYNATSGLEKTEMLFKNVLIKDGSDQELANGNDQWQLTDTSRGAIYNENYAIYQVDVEGVVKETTALEGAVVTLDNRELLTDENGYFIFDHVKSGSHSLSIRKSGYSMYSQTIQVVDQHLDLGEITLTKEGDFDVNAPEYIESDELSVGIDNAFPRIMVYKFIDGGEQFYGQTETLDKIRINGIDVKPTVQFNRISNQKVSYKLDVKDALNSIDAIIDIDIEVVKNIVTFKVTNIQDAKLVKTIEIPNHGLLVGKSTQQSITFAGSNMSTNTRKSGDTFANLANMSNTTSGYMFAILSSSNVSATLWSNSENNVTSDWQRIKSTVMLRNTTKVIELSSNYWTYQKGNEYRKEDSENELPTVKVALTKDANQDQIVDWQDGAIATREIIKAPQGADEVPNTVATRISMNFGSQAQNPFLMTLDNVKKVFLNTDGLGQNVLLKGYGSEGHDSGHLNYADVGTRIGGVEDFKYLLKEGKKYGAIFGVHVNASETYPESIYFSDSILKKDAQGKYSYGWNWLDQGINIDANYDLTHGRADRFKAFYDAIGGVDNDLDYIYVDVWGNGQSGDNGTWASSQLAKEINGLGWRLAGEWGHAFAFDSVLQHWATDLTYGGYDSKGNNSNIARFIQNHQRDAWIADYPSFGGAAINPLLGGYDMFDFEGWGGRNNYQTYITRLFSKNLTTKFLQHFEVTNWVNGSPVQMTTSGDTYTWTPEMKIILKDNDQNTVQVDRKSNVVSSADYSARTITYNGKKILDGSAYLIPWFWDQNGTPLAVEDYKLYHYNVNGGTTTWDVPEGWNSSLHLYELSQDGKINEQIIPIVNGKVTINAKANTPYVAHKSTTRQVSVDWSEGMHIVDAGFNSGDLDNWIKNGDVNALKVDVNAGSNRMLVMNSPTSDVTLTQTLTDLKPNQKYAVYVGVDNRSDFKASIEVNVKGEVISNYTIKSIAKNYIKANAHNTNSASDKNGTGSYFQNMYVFFTAPADGSDVTLTLRREAGSGTTYMDDLRIFENDSDLYKSELRFEQDFENVPQGIFPFVVGPIEGVQDNRTHLSQKHEPYTQRGWNGKAIDDVIDGNWALKTNGLVRSQNLVYQTIPQNYRFEPGVTYLVSFDYEAGSEGTYAFVVGDGEYQSGLPIIPLEDTTVSGKKRFTARVTGSESGQTWIGIYSTDISANARGKADADLNFSGYKDVILDNLSIVKSIADKSELEQLYNSLSDLYEKVYSSSSWLDFIVAKTIASNVLDNAEATQAQTDQAKVDLQAKYDALKQVAVVLQGTLTNNHGIIQSNVSIVVTVDGVEYKATTNEDGKYSIIGVPLQPATMTIEDVYNETYIKAIRFDDSQIVWIEDVVLTQASGSLKGMVSAVGKPVVNQVVTLHTDETQLTATTNELGIYEFTNIPSDTYQLIVDPNSDGYSLYRSSVDVKKEQTSTKNVMIMPVSDYDYIATYDDNTTTWANLAGNTSSTTIRAENQATTIIFPGGGHANVFESAAPKFKDGVVEMDITPVRNSERFGILLRANDMQNRVYVGTLENAQTYFVEYWGKNGNMWSGGYTGPTLAKDTKTHFKVEIVGTTVKLWVNDVFVLEETMDGMQLEVGSVGLNTRASNTVSVDNVKVKSYDEVDGNYQNVVGNVNSNGQPLANVKVELLNITKVFQDANTTTDQNGNYVFKNVPFGNYQVVVTHDSKQYTKWIVVKAVDGYILVDSINVDLASMKEELHNMIVSSETLDATKYTVITWNEFLSLLDAAKLVDEMSDPTYEQVSVVLQNLKNAQTKLIDKSALDLLLDQVMDMDLNMYTTSSIATLDSAIEDAEQMISSARTIAEIDAATSSLQAAIAGLKAIASDVVVSGLQDTITAVKALESEYTEAEFATLKQAIEDAETLLASDRNDISSDAVLLALKDIVDAKEALPVHPQNPLLDDLKIKVTYANTLLAADTSKYRPAKVQALRDAVAAGQLLIDEASGDVDTLQAAIDAVDKAIQEYWEIVSKVELNNLVTIYGAAQEANYTVATWAPFQAAIDAAKAVVLNDDATTQEVETAKKNLIDAYNALKKVEVLDKTALMKEIATVESMLANSSKYVASSIKDLPAALTAAKQALATSTSQAQLDAATKALILVEMKARLKADTSVLQALVAQAEVTKLSGYTSESVTNFQNALANAEAILQDEEATQAQVDAIVTGLQKAIDGLTVIKKDDKANENSNNSNNVATGDNTNLQALYLMLVLSLGIVVYTRKRKQKES